MKISISEVFNLNVKTEFDSLRTVQIASWAEQILTLNLLENWFAWNKKLWKNSSICLWRAYLHVNPVFCSIESICRLTVRPSSGCRATWYNRELDSEPVSLEFKASLLTQTGSMTLGLLLIYHFSTLSNSKTMSCRESANLHCWGNSSFTFELILGRHVSKCLFLVISLWGDILNVILSFFDRIKCFVWPFSTLFNFLYPY